MATAKQIAARKKFSEMAKSGKLAQLRKKSTLKSNPTANQEYSKLELVRSVADQITAYAKARGGMDKNDFMKAARILKKGDLKEARNFAATLDSDPRDYLLSMMDGLRQKNPTATRAASRKANPIRTFSVQLSDKKPIKTVTADSFDDALEMAVGQRFFSASSDSYRRSGDVTTDKFFNVMVKDPNGTTTYRDGKRLIRLKQIRAQVSLFEIPKRNPTPGQRTRSRTKLIQNGNGKRKNNPMQAYAIKCSRSGRTLGYADSLPMAKSMATAIANERMIPVQIVKA